MEEKTKEILLKYVSEGEPFGAVQFNQFQKNEYELKEIKRLFDSHNKIYETKKNPTMNRPTIIVGRKGAGKTAYIEYAYFDDRKGYKYDYRLNLPSEKMYDLIGQIENTAKEESYYAENIAELWETIFLVLFFSHIRNKFGDSIKENIYNYLHSIGIKINNNEKEVLMDLRNTILAQTDNSIIDINEYLQQDPFKKIKKEVHEIMSKKQRAIIMLDNPENFPLKKKEFSKAVSGLLKYIGNANNTDDTVDIRVCIPAEVYHEFRNCSSNDLKDFRRQLKLHWKIRELFVMAMNRFRLYCELHMPDLLERFDVEEFENFEQVQKALHKLNFFPEKITSRLGVEEYTLSYLGRHTQLLPRHLGILLNSIWSENKDEGNDMTKPFTEAIIRKGIEKAEASCVNIIFKAYESKWPNAKDCCNACFPEIQHVFPFGELHTVFTRHGKQAFQSEDFNEFKDMLIEIGAVGVVTNQTEFFVEADFEYNVPDQLRTRHDDKLCIHPLFSGLWRTRTDRLKKSVYPYGARLQDLDEQ